VERGEVYEKEWAEKSFGNIYIEKGIQKLTLQSKVIPGTSSIELKGIFLKKSI
jgi:hypothetical protein